VAQADTGAARAQRVLATLAFTLIGISAVDVVALLVLRVAGVGNAAFQHGGLLVMQLLPLPGLTLGLVFVVALFIVLAIRRSREQGSQGGRR
jgi:energy-converting hydrogenase Eha subunit H